MDKEVNNKFNIIYPHNFLYKNDMLIHIASYTHSPYGLVRFPILYYDIIVCIIRGIFINIISHSICNQKLLGFGIGESI